MGLPKLLKRVGGSPVNSYWHYLGNLEAHCFGTYTMFNTGLPTDFQYHVIVVRITLDIANIAP